MSFETLKHRVFDHKKPVSGMLGQEALDEFAFLGAGFADNVDPHRGVNLGLSPELATRQQELQRHLSKAVDIINATNLAAAQ